MTTIKKIILALAVYLPFTVVSQQQINLNQQAHNIYLINPANVATESGSMNAYYRKHWLSIPQSPEKILLSVATPVEKSRLGLGFIVDKETAGITQRSSFVTSLAYTLPLNEKQKIIFGVSGGFQAMTNDLSSVKAESMEEFAGQPQFQRAVTPNIAAGLSFVSQHNLKMGLAVDNLTQSSFSFKEPTTNRGYGSQSLARINLYVQHTFSITKNRLDYTPSVIMRSVNGTDAQIDIVNMFTIYKSLLLGVSYRTHKVAFISVGAMIGNFRLLYSYEMSLHRTSLGGIHETGIQYRFAARKATDSEAQKNERETDEIYEKLQEQEARIASMNRKTDSLDKNVNALNNELNSLKNKQVNEEDLLTSFEEMNRSLDTKHNLIKSSQAASTNDSVKASYQIVLGVYQLSTNARDYQKFLERTVSLSTTLIQIEGQAKKYIYVCNIKNYASLKEAAAALKETIKTIKKYSVEVTKGEPWILQTIQKKKNEN